MVTAEKSPVLRWYLAVFGKTRELVLLLSAVALVYYRSAMSVFVALGACCCAVIAKALKCVIRQERPPRTNGGTSRQSFGMPSSHSAGVVYYATLLSALLADAGVDAYTLVTIAILAVASAAAAWYRVQSEHHTVAQVAAGACLGVSLALVWWACRGTVLPCIEAVAAWAVGGR